MNAMQRAEAWAMDFGSTGTGRNRIGDRYLSCEINCGTAEVRLSIYRGPVAVGEGNSLNAAAADALRQLGITDFEEVSP